jgi:Spy/CpxP family protein refolding chaperone
VSFAAKPDNDFRLFIDTYFERCRAECPKLAAIAGKWTFEDLIPGLSDFDTRFIFTDGVTVEEWIRMSSAVGRVHTNLAKESPRWARILEHLPGLNLTQAQRDQLRSIREAQRPETQALREKMRAARQVLHEVMSADVPDEAAVRAAAGAVAALQADQAVLLARAKGQFMSVLTPEQQAQWKAARARTAERAQRIRMRMGRMMRQEFARQWRGGR